MSLSTKNTIKLENLTFFAFHGLNEEEIKDGQDFILNVDISYNLANSCDSIDSTIDYIDLYKIVKSSFSEKRFNLLESLANKLIIDIKSSYQSIYYIKISIRKPSISIGSNKDFINVETEYIK